ncbi:shikimate kinase [Trichodelitschia bisporula]|uniref:Gluconokinase n=1 Tax=Trichodelitschia bisporula TaxID=703511 RepID=A0A6G1HZK7_9PEZI|nr:shikimate kinase [Trichodelitschia bisporula]
MKPTRTPTMPSHRHLFIITGPAGCGKSTVAKFIANQFQYPFIEGDDFHSPTNRKKMSEGHPLTDSDRWEWLHKLRDEAEKALVSGASGAVLTCSALKRAYRDIIREVSENDQNVLVHFIYLRATQDLLLQRVEQREGHYMKAHMVKSQFDILEEPDATEPDVLAVDVHGSRNDVLRLAAEAVMSAIKQDTEPRS